MKRVIPLLTALIFTACSTSVEITEQTGTQTSAVITTETTASETAAEVTETVTEKIPELKSKDIFNESFREQCAEKAVIFNTEWGEYAIELVGSYVFTESPYTYSFKLDIEADNGSERISAPAYANSVNTSQRPYKFYPEMIGDYVTVCEMDGFPLIIFRYHSQATFYTIADGELFFFHNHLPEIGEDSAVSVPFSDEFIIEGKTIKDNVTNVFYTFDFDSMSVYAEYITYNSEKIYISEEIFPSQEHINAAKETAFTDIKIQTSIESDLEEGIITAETADGFRFIQGIHADFDNDREKESLIALALPARTMGGGSVIYVDGSEAFKLYTDINSSSTLNSYTLGGGCCFSVNGTSGGTYYFTSLFTVEDGIPKEKLNYNIIEYENNIFKCMDKFDSYFTYYIFDEETGDFIRTEI